MRQSVALLLIPLFALPLAARATETFQAQVSQLLTVPEGCNPRLVSYLSNSASGGVSQTCGDFTGVAGGTAFAASGQVGASANATDVTRPFISDSFAGWSDDHVVITKIGNPAAGGTTTASLNIDFNGNMGGLGAPVSGSSATLNVGFNTALFSLTLDHTTNGDFCQSNGAIDFCQFFHGTIFRGGIASPTITVPVNTPFSLSFSVDITAQAARPLSSADAGFSHTLGLAVGQPVLNFDEPGFTVNAGNYIVNNQYIAPVDEPAIVSLFAAGLSGIAFLRRRRVVHVNAYVQPG